MMSPRIVVPPARTFSPVGNCEGIPWGALGTCLLFGFLEAAAIRLQSAELPLLGKVPVQAVQALPYVLTVVLLAGLIGKAIPPKASGIPYVKER